MHDAHDLIPAFRIRDGVHRLASLHAVTEMFAQQARGAEHQGDAAIVPVVGRTDQRHSVPE